MQLFSNFAEGVKKEKAKENLPGNLGYALGPDSHEGPTLSTLLTAWCLQNWETWSQGGPIDAKSRPEGARSCGYGPSTHAS
jgi:hypothetical protein